MRLIEIMAPVGSWDSLRAAIQAKAHSIYFGIGHLNMRSHSTAHFTTDDLPSIMRLCQKHHIKGYVTLNSIIYDEDLALMREYCLAIKKSNVAAIIASDIAVIQFARSIGLNVHISTQLNICNLEAVRFFSQYSDVLVLARELTLDQIRVICVGIQRENIRGPSGEMVRIEVFVHGALCVSIAGKCTMSLALYDQSANRGQCTQPCRRKYRVIDVETENELLIDNQYIMSPKDLCTIGVLDRILDAGVSILKIEGRGRSPEYVYTVALVYREAAEAIQNGNYSPEKIAIWREQLKSVYNRGFWEGGYYLGEKLGEWCNASGSAATKKKIYAGKVTNYYPKIQVAEVQLESSSIQVGDSFLITGKTTGVIEGQIKTLHTDREVQSAEKGSLVAFPVARKVRKNDQFSVICKT